MHSQWVSAIHDNRLPRYGVRSAIGEHHLSDVVSAPGSPKDRLCADRLLLRHPLGHPRSFNQTRCNAVDGYVGRQGDRQAMCEMDQCRLARRVSDAAALRSDPGERSHIYEATRFVSLKLSGKTSCEQERPSKVGFEDPIPNLRRQCIELAERDANVPPRIVDENVDSPEMADHVSHA